MSQTLFLLDLSAWLLWRLSSSDLCKDEFPKSPLLCSPIVSSPQSLVTSFFYLARPSTQKPLELCILSGLTSTWWPPPSVTTSKDPQTQPELLSTVPTGSPSICMSYLAPTDRRSICFKPGAILVNSSPGLQNICQIPLSASLSSWKQELKGFPSPPITTHVCSISHCFSCSVFYSCHICLLLIPGTLLLQDLCIACSLYLDYSFLRHPQVPVPVLPQSVFKFLPSQ